MTAPELKLSIHDAAKDWIAEIDKWCALSVDQDKLDARQQFVKLKAFIQHMDEIAHYMDEIAHLAELQAKRFDERESELIAERDEAVKRAEENSLWHERFQNAAQFNARFEGQIEKMGELLHLCREGFLDIENHSIDRSEATLKFWIGYIHEIAYNMNTLIFEAEEKHGLPIRPVAQDDKGSAGEGKGIPSVAEKHGR